MEPLVQHISKSRSGAFLNWNFTLHPFLHLMSCDNKILVHFTCFQLIPSVIKELCILNSKSIIYKPGIKGVDSTLRIFILLDTNRKHSITIYCSLK